MAEDMIRWLYDLQHFGVKLGLDNIEALLRTLGRPERGYRTALIAGTNGKGSVAAMLDAMLGASGIASGLFTSPHLVRPNERIRIGGADIGTPELERRLAALRDVIHGALERGELATHPSFFEAITATALAAFRDHRLGAAVLEVGLGGRLDATNAVDADVPVIVSLDLDHVKTLGPTIEHIAAEKAGIVKAGRPLISGVVQQRGVDVIRRVCAERGAEYVDARVSTRLEARSERSPFTVTFCTSHALYPGLRIALHGAHQIDNARVALTAFEALAERLGFTPDPEAVREGLTRVRWPGRLQWIDPGDGGPRLLLDGAHNGSAMATLTTYLKTQIPASQPLDALAKTPLPVLLFGAVSGKPIEQMLAALAPWSSHVVLTRPPVDRGLAVNDVAALAEPLFTRVERIDDPARALVRARAACDPRSFVVVTGSLYLLGEILGHLSGARTPGPVSM